MEMLLACTVYASLWNGNRSHVCEIQLVAVWWNQGGSVIFLCLILTYCSIFTSAQLYLSVFIHSCCYIFHQSAWISHWKVWCCLLSSESELGIILFVASSCYCHPFYILSACIFTWKPYLCLHFCYVTHLMTFEPFYKHTQFSSMEKRSHFEKWCSHSVEYKDCDLGK
jgi:hypothetical protein